MKTDVTFKPLLASPVDLDKLKFPVMASPKLDGIRAINIDGTGLVSRNIKPIPNEFIRDVAYRLFPEGFDGELLTYTGGVLDDFSTTSSKVMSRDGEPEFRFHVFDQVYLRNAPFDERIYSVHRAISALDRQGSQAVEYLEGVAHELIHDVRELLEYEAARVAEGWEGVMLRDPKGLYKFGRSTTNEGILLKMKRFYDAEATIVGGIERMINTNEQTRDALGRAKRSTAKAGKVPAGDLGALECRLHGGTEVDVGPGKPRVTLDGDVDFEIGTGFTASQRVAFWEAGMALNGRTVKFKYQELSKDMVPRFPVFQGFRHEDDL